MYISYNINSRDVGRLGNKMFIIAACAGANMKYGNTFCFIPDWDYSKHFPNLVSWTNDNELKPVAIYIEKKFSFDELPKTFHITQVQGYFQSEKYFLHCGDYIRDLFKPSYEIENKLKYLDNRDYELTSIHIRRGDYLNLVDYHPMPSIDWYREAMGYFKDSQFLIFSDDLEWCKENFNGNNITFSEGKSDIEDLFAMSKCDNNIIANSSFSWWGAWLNKNLEKTVIAPKNWFGPKGPQDTQDLYPKEWIIL